jgi:hypothetical protein
MKVAKEARVFGKVAAKARRHKKQQELSVLMSDQSKST